MEQVILEIREISYENTYAIRHEVMWPDREIDYVKLEKDPSGIHFGGFVSGKLVSVISLFIDKETNRAQYRKFATLIDFQGQGIGGQMLKRVISEANRHGVNILWCNARLNATGLYERHGLKKTDQTFEKGGQSYVIMELKLNGEAVKV